MIEQFLIKSGFGCGTKKNFVIKTARDNKFNKGFKWYFRTPLNIEGSGLRTVKLDLVYPFLASLADENNVENVLTRLSSIQQCYEDDLLTFLRKYVIVPPDLVKFTIIPFWASDSQQKDDRRNVSGMKLHVLNAVLTVKFRDESLENLTVIE